MFQLTLYVVLALRYQAITVSYQTAGITRVGLGSEVKVFLAGK